MSRIVIEFPEQAFFTTEIEIQNIHINRGDHVGNHQYVELCNETCMRFFKQRGAAEFTVGKQVLLNAAFSVQVKSEAKYADMLHIELGLADCHRKGCDLALRISQHITGQLVALAQFSFLTFDYKKGRVVEVDPGFEDFFKP